MLDPQPDVQQTRFPVSFVMLVCLVIAICYFPTLNAPFVLDSKKLVTDRGLQTLQPIWIAATGSSRSLVNLTFALNYQWGGPAPWRYRAVNIAIHMAAAAMLLALVRRTLLQPSIPESLSKNANGLALATALIWAVHPLQTQAVTYVIQRYESTMALLFLLAMYLFLRGTQSKHGYPWYIATAVVCLLGMACKPVMVAVAPVILLYDYAFIAENWREMLRRRWWVYCLLIAASLWGVFLVRGAFNTDSASAIGLGLNSVSSIEYTRTQPEVILHYIRLAFWPGTLCIDYRWAVENSAFAILASSTLVAILLIGSLAALRWSPKIGFLGLAFFLVLAPTSSVMPILDLAVEHRMYLPLAAIVALAVVAVYSLSERLFQNPLARTWLRGGLLTLVVLGLMGRCFLRTKDYADPQRLWTKALEVNPQNDRAYNHLGELASARGKIDEAIDYHLRALELNERSRAAHVELSRLYPMRGRLNESIRHGQRAIELLPDEPVGYYNLGVAYQMLGRHVDAINQYKLAIEADPLHAEAHNNLALLYGEQGDTASAIQHFEAAIQASPRFNTAFVNLGELHRKENQPERAERCYRQALAVNPNYAPTYLFMGLVAADQGNIADAVSSMERAIQLSPNWAEPKLELAWLRATTRDHAFRSGQKGVMLAETGIGQLDGPPDAKTLDILAAAYASTGNFDHAKEVVTKAIQLVEGTEEGQGLAAMRKRLALYEQKKPYFAAQ